MVTLGVVPVERQLPAGKSTVELDISGLDAKRLGLARSHHATVTLLYDATATGSNGGETDLSGNVKEGTL